MMNNRRITTIIILLFGFSIEAFRRFEAFPLDGIHLLDEIPLTEKTLNRLEGFAVGDESTPHLTMNELKQSYEEYEALVENSEKWKYISDREPLVRLLEDLSLRMIKIDPEMFFPEDKKFSESYLKRLELFYRKFRPYYLGVKMRELSSRSKSIQTLISALKSEMPLTRKSLRLARDQYEALRKRFSNILEHEDFYSLAAECEALINLFNWPPLRTLSSFVFPVLREKPDIELDQVKDIFWREMRSEDRDIEEFLKIRRF